MLTTRVDGTSSVSLIKAAWWNDYLTLLTGGMIDQPVSLASNLTLKSGLSSPSAVGTAITSSGGSLGVGVYKYVFSYIMADNGESLPSASTSVTTTTGNQTVTYANILPGPAGTVKRNVYRTTVNGSSFFYVTTLNNNTSTSMIDTTADASLNTGITPNAHSDFGGALIFRDTSGTRIFTIYPDGTFVGAGGGTAFGSTTINGNLTVTGDTFTDGRLSRTVAGDIIDASTSANTFIKAGTGINLQVPNGSTVATVNTSGITLAAGKVLSTPGLTTTGSVNLSGGTLNLSSGTTISAANLAFNGTGIIFGSSIQTNGALLLSPGNTGTPSTIQCGTAGFGIKDNSGTKLFEIKANGVAVIHGTSYTSTAASVTVTGSGTFDTFDTAETFFVDQQYVAGTVVCPADTTTEVSYVPMTNQINQPLVTQCTHDACTVSMIVVDIPGNCLGVPNVPTMPWYDNTLPLCQSTALNGRIFANTTATSIPAKSYICSDGLGGVRAVVAGEHVQSMGITIGPIVNGKVPILVRPTFVVL